MNSNINIKYMNQQLLENLKEHSEKVGEKIKTFSDTLWLKEYASGPMYEKKKISIPDFTLSVSEDGDYNKVDYINSIKLYENLNKLPRYILANENFWAWLEFDKFYDACRQAMPITSKSTFKDHWVFSGGNRRGIFFGVLSRCYFRVELSVDERLADKYELTKFIIEKPERFRNLSWRSISSEKHFVLAVLRAEKDVYDEYIKDETKAQKIRKAEGGEKNIYTELTKYLSLYGSVRLLDILPEEEIYTICKNKLVELIENY